MTCIFMSADRLSADRLSADRLSADRLSADRLLADCWTTHSNMTKGTCIVN